MFPDVSYCFIFSRKPCRSESFRVRDFLTCAPISLAVATWWRHGAGSKRLVYIETEQESR